MLLHYLDDMDSKMECMRHLIETDRQMAGNFTSYSEPLERVVLKKDRYLGDGGPRRPPTCHPPTQRPEPAQPASRSAAPKTNSPFANKLLQALQPAEAKRESLMRKAATRAIPPPLELPASTRCGRWGKAA